MTADSVFKKLKFFFTLTVYFAILSAAFSLTGNTIL